MTIRADGTATDPEWVDAFDGGFGWIAHPGEQMRRASHALVDGDDVWVVDPVDAEGLDDRLAEHGDVAGVVVLLGRHERDCAAVANRHDVAVHAPPFVPVDVTAPVERVPGTLGDTDFEVLEAVNWPGWHEAALSDGDTLVVADALGTTDYYRGGDERLGVNPVLRLTPPEAFEDLAPERVLCGHGDGVHEDASAALRRALDGARKNAVDAWLNGLRAFV